MYHSTLGSRVIKKKKRVGTFSQAATPVIVAGPSSAKVSLSTPACPCAHRRGQRGACCGIEAGSYLRRIDSCITQLKAQGHSRTCSESKEDEEGEVWHGETPGSRRDVHPPLQRFSWRCMGGGRVACHLQRTRRSWLVLFPRIFIFARREGMQSDLEERRDVEGHVVEDLVNRGHCPLQVAPCSI